jgi:UDP:flavonoid glycosyltransferase YjiC (YdhE family)
VARILIGWEFGRNLGHIARDLPLARACRDAGHEVVWAVPDLRAAASQLEGEGFLLLQTPLVRASASQARPISFSDMLLREGYDDSAGLLGSLHGWVGLVRLAAPAVIVHDYAPTALLAARVTGVPAMVLGSGFMVPPPVTPTPGFWPAASVPAQALQEADARLVARINAALAAFGAPAIASLVDVYAQGGQYLTTFEELDPFGPRPGARYFGPMFALGKQSGVDWTTTGKPRIFAYLRPEVPGCENLLEALQAGNAEVVCAMPGLPQAWVARFDRLRFVPGAVDMDRLLPGADLAITNGSGTIPSCLLAGVPVLVLPHFVEQYLAGMRLQNLGAGLVVQGARTTVGLAAMLGQLLSRPSFRETAQAFARRYAGHDREATGRRIFEALKTLLPR